MLVFSSNIPLREPECNAEQPAEASPRRVSATSSPLFLKKSKHTSSGEQSGPATQKSLFNRSTLRKRLHSSSSVPNFLKFLAPVAENSTSDFNGKKSDFEIKSSHSDVGCDSPVRTRRHSWRQQIFLRVATPQKGCDSPNRYEGKQ
ncbi:TBC1 domain family member 1-like [Bombina bombina]|uniref:TBC1 domain family member 1-like n=1 Tax=Bombina bombina TaxID=8345 RepID=UPI00235AEA83|nr:TBC1 domain family member 1-like [Bombina bombina]